MTTTTAKGAAERYGVSVSTIYRRCRNGRLDAAKVCGRWVIQIEEEQTVEQPRTYQGGDVIEVAGDTIRLTTWKGSRGLKWGWRLTDSDEGGSGYKRTPEEAIEDARRKLGALCSCGRIAEMGGSCVHCYDRHAD